MKKQYPDRDVVRVREPGKTPIAEAIRTLVQGTEFEEPMDPICEAYLYAASRAQLLNTVVRPALEAGAIIVSDRSFWSSLAYQGFAKDEGIETIWMINQPIVHNAIPDLVLFFDMPVEQGLARTFDAQGDKHETNGKAFFEKVYEGYEQCLTDTRFAQHVIRIDAQGDIQQVQARVERQILDFLSHGD